MKLQVAQRLKFEKELNISNLVITEMDEQSSPDTPQVRGSTLYSKQIRTYFQGGEWYVVFFQDCAKPGGPKVITPVKFV